MLAKLAMHVVASYVIAKHTVHVVRHAPFTTGEFQRCAIIPRYLHGS